MTVSEFFIACLTGLGAVTAIVVVGKIVVGTYCLWALSGDKRRARQAAKEKARSICERRGHLLLQALNSQPGDKARCLRCRGLI